MTEPSMPPLPVNLPHIVRRIRRCEEEVPAQVVLEHAMHAYAQPLLERIKELEADAARAPRQIEIGRAVERACEELPDESDGIEIRLERNAGTVYYLKNGLWKHIEDGDTFGDQINKAIDAALSTKDKP